MDHSGYIARTAFSRTFAEQCKSGRPHTPAYLPGTTGLKDVRLSKNARLHIRAATRISLSNGSTDEAAAVREYETPIRNKRERVSAGTPLNNRARRAIARRENSMMGSALYR